MGTVAALECILCGRRYADGEVLYTCPACGPAGILDVQYDYDAVAAGGFGPDRLAADPDRTQWRYLDLLPVSGTGIPPVPVGWTPIFPLPDMAERLGVGELWLKDEGRNPTGSFKDRASAVAAVKARELGFATVCCAATGDAASSIAGIWKGLQEMRRFGVIDRLPRLIGTQASGAAPLLYAWQAGEEHWAPVEARTVADSISVGQPRNGLKALRAVRESGGVFVAVSDDQILAAEADLAAHGVFGEPAGVAGLAGIQQARWSGLMGPDERVVHVMTGS